MGDRFNLNNQQEHLQLKYVGTGHADISRYEWLVNQHRDSIASYLGHDAILTHLAVVENESFEGMRCKLLMKMVQPCGPPPPPKEAGLQ